jgi:predicted XRE-type DNA-binding protein
MSYSINIHNEAPGGPAIERPREHPLKAALVVQLKRLIAERELTQTATAKLIGMKQPDLSKLPVGFSREADADADGVRSGCGNHIEASSQTGRGRADHIDFGGKSLSPQFADWARAVTIIEG